MGYISKKMFQITNFQLDFKNVVVDLSVFLQIQLRKTFLFILKGFDFVDTLS